MKKGLNIGLLLDICGILYDGDQLVKLEKLIEDFLHPDNDETTQLDTSDKDDHDTFNEEAKDLNCDYLGTKFKLEGKSDDFLCKNKEKSISDQKLNCDDVRSKKIQVQSKKNTSSFKASVQNLCQHCGKVFETPDQLRF